VCPHVMIAFFFFFFLLSCSLVMRLRERDKTSFCGDDENGFRVANQSAHKRPTQGYG
jgi:hypothetical protein